MKVGTTVLKVEKLFKVRRKPGLVARPTMGPGTLIKMTSGGDITQVLRQEDWTTRNIHNSEIGVRQRLLLLRIRQAPLALPPGLDGVAVLRGLMAPLDHPVLLQHNNLLPHRLRRCRRPALDTTLVQMLGHLTGKPGVQKLRRMVIKCNPLHYLNLNGHLAQARHTASNIASPLPAMTLTAPPAAIGLT
ncbi:hypothetical protein BJV78DRAFT_774674 [Lactifluus subvellereus]|nr:hypothetical protein BJV78DRAFT_774674 [Lactifluus subvellereus]